MTAKSNTIMIVEDSAELVKLYEMVLLKNEFYILGKSENGQDAVELYRSSSEYPDLIIIDYRMPLKDGITASKEILEMNPNQRIFMISADDSIENQAARSGITQFLKKPFDLEEFVDTVTNLVMKQSSV